MKLPLTLHPANHLAVQCLLLHAALSSDSVSGFTMDYAQHEQYNMAASIARLRTRYNWEGRFGPRHIVRLSHCWEGLLRPPAATAATSVTGRSVAQSTTVAATTGAPVNRVDAPSSALETTQQQQPADGDRALAFTAPARLIALYAPPVLLRGLQRRIHDMVSYDAAVHHASLLLQLLAPYGVHVALTGATRRGCPFSLQAEYLLCLTEAETREVEAVHPDGAGGVEESDRGAAEHAVIDDGDGASGSGASAVSTAATAVTGPPMREAPCSTVRAAKQQRRVRAVMQRDALMLRPPSLPSAASRAAAAGVPREEAGGGTGHHRQEGIRGRLRGSLRRRHCDRHRAFSSVDDVSPQVSYRVQRALASLVRCGYIVSAAQPFPPSQSCLEARTAIRLTARYDPHLPTQVPPRACTDPAVLRRLQLHQLVLHLCPWHALAARQLFLTGPADYTTHVTLQALDHGVNVNMNGVFVFGEACAASGDGGVGSTTPVIAATAASEAHPGSLATAHHEGQPQRRSDLVEQLILQDEEDLVSLAGLPRVDPMLRGLYCQQNHL
ncbi:conserved hypothetical protein [Leishmania mexicana MHOM/GT/2001/U1103]|uniref:Uncharacterized protein n=1 Tax=Leishmania mexicana (strain MHOM/GT/2001/U1103) TaxID=929439 RepID=E9AJC8_LEIMU|nr:conserved hypothetical protein [Leishmania mexicana MHOM/GT/2001/U1103]CBZ23025.1 conserved hypothetical protein [Leishmania mexicana MHOM/GT/2001/U1103]